MDGMRVRAVRNWGWLLGLALLLRLAIAPFAYGFQYDMDTFGSWAAVLVDEPFSRFYDVAPSPDHLPGDLYLHFLAGEAFQLAGGENFHGEAYRFLLKAIPAVADILVALVIHRLVRRHTGEDVARLSSLLYALNPGTIFLSAIWGQWDVVSGLLLLLGFGIIWRWPARWLWSIPVFAWAVLIKPPLALLALIGLMVVPLRDLAGGKSLVEVIQRRSIEAAAAVMIGLATMVLLMLPFDTGFPGTGMRWSLLDRVEVAVELYPFTTLGAANIWMIPLGSPDRRSDQDGMLMGLTEQQLGTALLVLALVYVAVALVRMWRRVDPVTLTVWAMAVSNYAYFLLPTRAHERYLYPAVLLLVLLAGLLRLDRRMVRITCAVSAVYVLNLVGVYYSFPGVLAPIVFVTLSLANIALFGAVAAWPFWRNGGHDDSTADAATPLPDPSRAAGRS